MNVYFFYAPDGMVEFWFELAFGIVDRYRKLFLMNIYSLKIREKKYFFWSPDGMIELWFEGYFGIVD